MHARITSVKLWPDTWTDYEIRAERRVLESKSYASGRLAVFMIRTLDDPDTGINISLWDNRESLLAYENTDWHQKRMLPVMEKYMAGEIPVGHGQVRFWYDSAEGWRVREKRHTSDI